jgi:hypothetical protein
VISIGYVYHTYRIDGLSCKREWFDACWRLAAFDEAGQQWAVCPPKGAKMKTEFLIKDMVELRGLDSVGRKKAARSLFWLALGHVSVWAAVMVMAALIALIYQITGYGYIVMAVAALVLGVMCNKIAIHVLRKKHSSDIERIRAQYS